MNAWQNSGHSSQKVINRRNIEKSLAGGSFLMPIFFIIIIYYEALFIYLK